MCIEDTFTKLRLNCSSKVSPSMKVLLRKSHVKLVNGRGKEVIQDVGIMELL